MSTTNSYPDALSFSGNIKTFEITSSTEVVFELWQDTTLVLSEKYQPNASNLVSVNVKAVVEGLLSIVIPNNLAISNEQTAGVGNFKAVIDTRETTFKVIKGGVDELTGLAGDFAGIHFLTWQPADKYILQVQPEWLGLYAVSAGIIKLKAYYADETNYLGTYATPAAGKLYSFNTGWGAVSAWLIAAGHSGQAVAWDVWYEVDAARVTPVQRYRLRNEVDDEHVFVWVNTLGAIDSVSFNGASEEDEKLTHKTAIYADDSVSEYDIDKGREITQYTGLLERDASLWITDFFYSRKKYVIIKGGSLKAIAVTESKVISNSLNDEFAYQFTYRFGADSQLLNLDRTHTAPPAPEGLDAFFLTELLSGLNAALYSDNLVMAVQSPFSRLWQVLTLAQLWAGALPGLVDGTTIGFVNGQLKALISAGTGGWSEEEIKQYIDSLISGGTVTDNRTLLISGAVVWRTALTYKSTDIVYKISGIQMIAKAKPVITLAAADATYGRLDTFYVDTFGNLNVLTGIPSANPQASALSASQLAVLTVLVAAGATAPSDVNNEIVYDENTEWAASGTHGDYISIDFASASGPSSNSKRIKIATAVPDEVVASPLHYLGEAYQGGRIFELSADGKSGLIAAENDTAVDMFWSPLSGYSTYSTGATGVVIGTGKANTDFMLANAAAMNFAAKFCDQLIVDGYNDFYMPSEDELSMMYFRRYQIGNFGTKTYWSSTETEWKRARCITFNNGAVLTRDKNNPYCVRAIRSFDDATIVNHQPVLTCTVSNTVLTFLKPTGAVAADKGMVIFDIKSSAAWLQNSYLGIESYQGSVRTGGIMLSPSTTLEGYNPADNGWQMVAIPMSKFYPTLGTINCFKITLSGSWPNNLDLGLDNIRYQFNNSIPSEESLLTPGTYGSSTKTLKITVSPAGKITHIEELDITGLGGTGVADNGLTDIAFEFRDITPGVAQDYNLDISAIWKYKIMGIALETDTGTLTGVMVKINGVNVDAIASLTISATLAKTMATGSNAVIENDRVKLYTTTGYTGTPTTIRGKLIVQKTTAVTAHSNAFATGDIILAQDTDFNYMVGVLEPVFIQVIGANNQVLGFERTFSMGVWSIKVIGTDAQNAKVNYQNSYNGAAPALSFVTENIALPQDVDYTFIAGMFEPVFIQVFGANGQELGFERLYVDNIWKVKIIGTDAQTVRIDILTAQEVYSSALTFINTPVYMLQDTDYLFFVGVTEPKFIQVFGANGQLLGFERVFADAMWKINIFGSDAQTAKLIIQL